MSSPIENYAIIGNCATLALVGKDGSIDWLGLPRFDSAACFAALLGGPQFGRWLIAPTSAEPRVARRYRGDTLILETFFETKRGSARLIDFMSTHGTGMSVVRIVRGERGTLAMHTELIVRYGYGSIVPWVSRRDDGRLQLVAGPDRLLLDTGVPVRGENMRTVGEFEIGAGDEVSFTLTWTPSFHDVPALQPAGALLDEVHAFWSGWAEQAQVRGEWSDVILRSLITLKALSHSETGGIIAAGTTSLPELLGGSRNWDYRYCWLRDATFTLYALVESGFLGEAQAWRDWLLRAVAGNPQKIQPLYGVAGERWLHEFELAWLPGYEGAVPVRIGNAASNQLQLDVYGEVMDSLYAGRRAGLPPDPSSWGLERAIVQHLEEIWNKPDNGIWEIRGPPQHFTHSKVMVWVAFDRAIRSVEEFGHEGPVARWRALRDEIHAEICRRGFDPEQNSFVHSYGAKAPDASLLRIPLVGFLPPSDPRVIGTIAAVERHLMRDGLIRRYQTHIVDDGLPPGDGAFLACSFWLVDNYVLQGRHAEAKALFVKLLGLANDVGLLSEEYDTRAKRLIGNFPQAFSHLALINAAHNLSVEQGPAHKRSGADSPWKAGAKAHHHART
ncbi:MAG TPA: glycoside hydrolase family 15 protein [Gemmataceae bacterium]|nr:glycoside hydrolase family 15 protein [Gemmataceae bacterium]